MDRQSHPRDPHGRGRENRPRKGTFFFQLTLRAFLSPPTSCSSLTHANFDILLFQNVIEINRPPQPIYQTVIEKTRGLAFRTQALGAAMARQGVAQAEGPTAAVEASQ